METIKLIFVDGCNAASEVIKAVTGSQWSHVGVMTKGGIVEAVTPRVLISSLGRYDRYPQEIVEVQVPDPAKAMEELKSLIGRPYGFLDCVSGGLHDLFDAEISLTDENTVNCCEVAVRTLRAGGVKIEEDLDANCFTPGSLYTQLKMQEF